MGSGGGCGCCGRRDSRPHSLPPSSGGAIELLFSSGVAFVQIWPAVVQYELQGHIGSIFFGAKQPWNGVCTCL